MSTPFRTRSKGAILAAAHVPYQYGLQLAFFIGMRTSELIGLEWERADMQAWTITVDRAVAEGGRQDSSGPYVSLSWSPRPGRLLRG
ncbi:hypothetical protein AWV80_04070 [Cupriavidus sp. UYMU48A]|nr:hypothetical protein AWV80_04070 [Cupriavidus sp. UYMU48A]